MRIIDEHVNLWKSFVENKENRLRNCLPRDEADTIQELHLTRQVLDSLMNLQVFLDEKTGA